jgi:hypothetical protein
MSRQQVESVGGSGAGGVEEAIMTMRRWLI